MLTHTQNKAIARSIRDATGDSNIVQREVLRGLSARHNVKLDLVVKLAEELQYMVVGPSEVAPEAARPEPTPKKPEVSSLVKLSILKGSIYKQLRPAEPEDDEKEDDMLVVTTLGSLRRERRALVKWLRELGVQIPEHLEWHD